MKGLVLLGIVGAALLLPTSAQAHHASASKITGGTFWVCTDNYAISKGKTRETRGTTKIHIHKVKPTRNHYRRHKCHKRKIPLKTITKTITVTVPGPERIVYVQVPCVCPAPPEQPKQPCKRKDHADKGKHYHGKQKD